MNSRDDVRRPVTRANALALVLLIASFACTSRSPPRHEDSRPSTEARDSGDGGPAHPSTGSASVDAGVAGPDAGGAGATPAHGDTRMLMTVGSARFIVTLNDNTTATAFRKMLPLTLEMTELNGNEKYYDLPKRLPADASNPGTIQAGDVMLYGAETLVVFYKTFRTSYSYTRIGKVDDPSGLAAALGPGAVAVTFTR
jgi:hypothetical protein